MTTLDDLWQRLFDEPISSHERRIMNGVLDYVGERSPSLVLAAILVYTLTLVLLRDPGSPFVVSRKLGDAMNKLEKRLHQNEQGAYIFKLARNELFDDIELTKNVLALARKDAREREDLPARAYWKIGLVSFAGMLGAIAVSFSIIELTGSA